jgi:hypothetical protein
MLFSSRNAGTVARWLRRHPWTLTAAVLFAAAAFPFCFRQDSEWESVYVSAARLLRQGGDIYRPENGYLYPPFMTILALPFSWLPSLSLRGAWFLLNAFCILVMVRCAWKVAGGPRLEGTPAPAGEHLAAVLGILCGIVYIQNCLAHQQTDLVIGALLMGGCLLLKQSRVFAAASCFGTAAAFKCTPLLWAPYLLWRRRVGAATWVVVLAAALNFLPDLVHRATPARSWVAAYAQRFLAPLTSPHHYIGTWGSDPIYNQSLSGGVHRWFLTELAWSDSNCTIEPRTQPSSPAALRSLAYGAVLLLVLLTLVAAGRPGRVEGAPAEQRLPLECSAVLLLMLLLSPMSSLAHFGTLILPAFCLARAAMGSRRGISWIAPGTAGLLAVTASKDLLGERLYTVLLWSGSVTCETVVLLGGCLTLLYASPQATTAGAKASLRRAA